MTFLTETGTNPERSWQTSGLKWRNTNIVKVIGVFESTPRSGTASPRRCQRQSSRLEAGQRDCQPSLLRPKQCRIAPLSAACYGPNLRYAGTWENLDPLANPEASAVRQTGRWNVEEQVCNLPFDELIAHDERTMRNLKLIIASILAILVAIIVVQNREPVETHLLFATLVMPHAILLFLASAAGFALGILLTMSLKTRSKNVP